MPPFCPKCEAFLVKYPETGEWACPTCADLDKKYDLPPYPDEWVPVYAMLPDGPERVLVALPDDLVMIGYLWRSDTGQQLWRAVGYESIIAPTHWRPLPEPPQ